MKDARDSMLRSCGPRLPKRRVVLPLVSLVALLAGCSGAYQPAGESAAASPTTVRMVQEWPVADAMWIPWVVAKKNGFYREAGVDVQLIPPPNSAATIQYLGTGRADVGFSTSMDIVFAKAQNVPVVSIAAYGGKNNWGLLSLPGQPTALKDIKGKTIGTYNDSWSKAQLRMMLQSVGLGLDDVKLVTASSDTVPLLLQHKVDAITGVTNAEGSELASQGVADYVMTPARDHGVPDSPVWGLSANTDWLAKNRGTAVGFMRATIRGWQYALAHPEEAVRSFLAEFPTAESPEFATRQWADTAGLFGPVVDAKTIRQTDAMWAGLLDAAVKANLVPHAGAPGTHYTNEILDAS